MTVKMRWGRTSNVLTVSKIIKNVHKECDNLHQPIFGDWKKGLRPTAAHQEWCAKYPAGQC